MKRNKIILAFLTITVLLAIGAIGFVMSVGGYDTVNLDCIIDEPDEWVGKKVKVEGVVGFTSDDMFILWNTCLESSVTVKFDSELPACESCRVMVTGEVTTVKYFGKERLFVLADEWNYIGY